MKAGHANRPDGAPPPPETIAGRRVLLTRSEEDCAGWAAELERCGIASVILPCIAAEPLNSPALAPAIADAAARADWLVFTSRRGVEAFARLASGLPAAGRVAVVGAATADAALRHLGRVDLVGERGTAEDLVASLRRALTTADARVLLALAANAPDTLEHALVAAGAECRRFDVYRTVPAARCEPRTPLTALGVDAVLLASPSAAMGFVNQVEADPGTPIVAIGPTTARAGRALGLEVAAEARAPSLEGMIEAAARALSAVPVRRFRHPAESSG